MCDGYYVYYGVLLCIYCAYNIIACVPFYPAMDRNRSSYFMVFYLDQYNMI